MLERAAPVELDAVPALQLTQPVTPATGWYAPAGHFWQMPFKENIPAVHSAQLEESVDPVSDVEYPAGHATQPEASLKGW